MTMLATRIDDVVALATPGDDQVIQDSDDVWYSYDELLAMTEEERNTLSVYTVQETPQLPVYTTLSWDLVWDADNSEVLQVWNYVPVAWAELYTATKTALAGQFRAMRARDLSWGSLTIGTAPIDLLLIKFYTDGLQWVQLGWDKVTASDGTSSWQDGDDVGMGYCGTGIDWYTVNTVNMTDLFTALMTYLRALGNAGKDFYDDLVAADTLQATDEPTARVNLLSTASDFLDPANWTSTTI